MIYLSQKYDTIFSKMLKLNELSERQAGILGLFSGHDWLTATYIIQALTLVGSPASIKRDLKALYGSGYLEQMGKARATKYRRSLDAFILKPIDANKYFVRAQDQRGKNFRFNLEIFKQLEALVIFNVSEKRKLTMLSTKYKKNITNLSKIILKKEFERVTIDLSWKSSAIEGNTYTLLETETLLNEGILAQGRTVEEAKMITNHKKALEYIQAHAATFKNLNVKKIEEVHSLLGADLGISKNIRKRMVGITGTNYKPLDNEFQIREAMENTCQLINSEKDLFAKALLAILLISYIQPFEDGNKRTARLIGNAVLLADEQFPLSFRSVDITQYKKAILLFYEINNISEFKNIFIEQAAFAVEEYFR